MDAIQATAQVAFQTSATGRVRTWNADCERHLGYTSKEILHGSIACLLGPAERKNYRNRLAEYREHTGRLHTTKTDADGHHLDLYLTFVPQFSRRGKFEGYNVIAQVGKPRDPLQILPECSNEHVQKVLDCLVGTFSIVDQAGNILVWNKKLEEVLKLTRDEVLIAHMLDFLDEKDRPGVQEKLDRTFERGDAFLEELDLVDKNGIATPYYFSASRIELHGKRYVCGMGLDLSRQKAQEEMLRLTNRALLASVNGIVITRNAGKDNPIVYINPAFERITGYSESEVIGRDSRFMAAPGLDELERRKIRDALDQGRETHVVFRNLRKNGEVFWNELTIAPVQNSKGGVTHFIGVINDVTASKQRSFHLEHEANHDALTGLANRNLFRDRLEQAIYSATRNKSLVAIVFIDLDGFKLINDTKGHEAGDDVLCAIAKRLKACVRENDTVARLGGDEFVLILANQPSLRFTLRMIERLRQSIAKPVLAGGNELHVGASLGVSVFPHDGISGSALLHAADAAMYHAKTAGSNNVQFFSSEMKSTLEAKHELECHLRNAIDKNEMFLVFQPRICLRTAKIIGAEALLRWRHPKRGVLNPASFMPLAEESGMTILLGEWALTGICSTLNRLQNEGLSNFSMSHNISFKEFSRPDFAAMMEQQLIVSGISPGCLEIEIAEDDLMRNPQYSVGALAELKQLGVKLAVDDFGSGFSSLSYLQKFPVSHLAIDRSFIADLGINGADAAITRTVITMGHNLDIDVVAKGVETGEQLDFLMRHDCDQIQGNYFSYPLYSSELSRMLKTNAPLRL